MLELFPNQVHWLWDNFDIKILKNLIDSSMELKKPKNDREYSSSSKSFEEINSKIEKEKALTKDWLEKNKDIIVNGKSLEELSNFNF